MISLSELLTRLAEKQDRVPFEGTLLAFDPGETTGYAVFKNATMIANGQINTKSIKTSVSEIERLLQIYDPKIMVLEDYRVYSWKSTTHKWSNVYTARVIGCMLTLASQRNVNTITRLAANPKGFVTDDKLKAWNLYVPGQRHARDAIRHAIYHLLFDTTKQDCEVNPQDTDHDPNLAKPLSK